ncbi:MAG: hypothetical protein HY735_27565 [Verrucomicrobia bacterium]|nr:hypothetical protein [Verrucomicrobiota bacterium]
MTLKDGVSKWNDKLLEFAALGLGERELRTAIFSFAHGLARDEGIWTLRCVVRSLTTPLMRAFVAGDDNAKGIVSRAADDLVEQHKCACSLGQIEPHCGPLVFYGGVMTHNRPFCDLVYEKIKEKWELQGVRLPDALVPEMPGTLRPACGALLFALGGSERLELRLPSREIFDYLLRQVVDGSREELRND